MIDERFIDLDELILLCKSYLARQYIAEAVACYRGGAFRSCIVATWIAVVFDFVEKLRQLELAGDANAKKRREEFEKYRLGHDIKGSLLFERNVAVLARDEFELISDIECSDLHRLLEDRNRCAHPSMNDADEIYSPSAELARAHLRNAVMHLLRHPPVQGKAALERILNEIKSSYFPTAIDQVAIHFERGPLANPRESLVRNLVVVLLKTLVRDCLVEGDFRRHAAALNGTKRLHPAIAENVMTEWVSKLIRGLGDDRLPDVILLMRYVPDTWALCDDDVRIKMGLVVEQLPEDKLGRCLPVALEMAPLQPCAMKRIAYATPNELCALVDVSPRAEYADRAVDFYTKSDNEAAANTYGSRLMVPMAPFLGASHVESLFSCVTSNPSVSASNVLGSVLRSIQDAGRVSAERFRELVSSTGLDVTFEWLLSRAEARYDGEGNQDGTQYEDEDSQDGA